MQIFFTASIKGGRAMQPEYEKIVTELTKYGSVFSQHVASDQVGEFGESNLNSNEILEREKRKILQSDFIIAEITTNSLGVGYLLYFASSLDKKIICFYRGENTLRVSSILKGDNNIKIENYESFSELQDIIKNIFI